VNADPALHTEAELAGVSTHWSKEQFADDARSATFAHDRPKGVRAKHDGTTAFDCNSSMQETCLIFKVVDLGLTSSSSSDTVPLDKTSSAKIALASRIVCPCSEKHLYDNAF
jgi:hypothetical protein